MTTSSSEPHTGAAARSPATAPTAVTAPAPVPVPGAGDRAGFTGGRCPRCDQAAELLPPERRYPITWHSDSTHDADGFRTGPFPFTADELRERDRLFKLTPAQLWAELDAWRRQLGAAATS